VSAFSETERIALIAVLGTTIPALLGLLGIYVQNRRLSKDQRADHANTAAKVDALVLSNDEMAQNVREVKADLRDVKDEVRSHGDRLRNLEHMTITQDHTDAIVANNARKLQAIQEHQNKESA